MALRNAPVWLAVIAMATPAAAQFGGLIPRDAQNVLNDAQATDACGNKKKSSAGSRILGGVLGRSARNAAGQAGISSWVPISEVTDQLTLQAITA